MKLNLNLADRIYVHRRALFAAYVAMATILLVMLVVSLVLFARARGEIADLEQRLGELRERVAVHDDSDVGDLSPAAQRQLLSDIAFANAILERDNFRWTQLLDRLEELVPEGVSIRSILPDHRTGSLNLTVVARGLSEMTAFLDQLMASEHLGGVYLLRQEKTTVTDFAGREREALQFSLTLGEAF
ncbi:PilN domain-containing protein [Geoalkalibacter halelectricus]|uniref:PilN domain-containing protein n=1 Tax=Geoalkalibacter halelectricus TaxID=2847045 RepID=A0ABY5ZR65_9BACT|nr:PilN domain-containing protein [Geoalkalibacter halelectricus]UWZ81176.1 PilN domain-containing protein [Geoalkalibacter halelectricus]